MTDKNKRTDNHGLDPNETYQFGYNDDPPEEAIRMAMDPAKPVSPPPSLPIKPKPKE